MIRGQLAVKDSGWPLARSYSSGVRFPSGTHKGQAYYGDKEKPNIVGGFTRVNTRATYTAGIKE